MKMLLCLSGRAHASHPSASTCIYCPCTMKSRKDLTQLEKFTQYKLDSDERQHEKGDGVREDLLAGWIPRHRIILDPLHCLLRLFDVLFERFRERLGSYMGEKKANDALAEVIKPLVPNFRFFKNKKDEWGYTSINGNDRLLILKEAEFASACPDRPIFGAYVQNLCRKFADIHISIINSSHPPPPEQVKKELHSWLRASCSAPATTTKKKIRRGSRVRAGAGSHGVQDGSQGFNSDELVTVYVHAITAHLHELVRLHGTIKPFSMQNLELHNNLDGKMWSRKCSRRRDRELLEIMMRQLRCIFMTAGNRKAAKLAHKCDLCGKLFKQKGRLQSHQAKKHGACSGESHKCVHPGCSKSYSSPQALKLHSKRTHVDWGGERSLIVPICFVFCGQE